MSTTEKAQGKKTKKDETFNELVKAQVRAEVDEQLTDALFSDALYCYEADITDNTIYKAPVGGDSDEFYRGLSFEFPIGYDEYIRHWGQNFKVNHIDASTYRQQTAEGLEACFKKGKRHIEFDYNISGTDEFRRKTILLYSRKTDGHLIARVALHNITSIFREETKHTELLEKAYRLTKSLTNAYYQCYNFDLVNGTYVALKQASFMSYMSESNSSKFAIEKWLSILPQKSAEAFRKFIDFSTIDERMKDKDSISIEYMNAIGKWLRAYLIVSNRDISGHITSVTLASQDIDEEKLNEIERAEAVQDKVDFFSSISEIYEAMYQLDFLHKDFIELSYDKKNRFLGMNLEQAWEQWTENDFTKKTYKEHKDFLCFTTLKERLSKNGVLSEDILTAPHGWMNFIIVPYKRDLNGEVTDALLLCRSIDAQKKAEIKQREELKLANNAANIDGLTCIPNRTALKKYIIDNEADSSECYVAIFDIDNFKKYNDTYGHVMGDETLKSVAASINAIAQGNKCFCCRYGGEEFVLITRGYKRERVASILEDISTDVTQKEIKHIATVLGIVSISVGFAQRSDGESILDTLKRADDALYHSKQNGRNRVTFASADIKSGHRVYDVTFAPSSTRYLKKTEETAKNEVDELTEALKVRSHQLEVIMNSIPGGMKISRMDDIFSLKHVSREAAAMFGYTIDEFIEYAQNSAYYAVIEEDRERATEEIKQKFKGDKYVVQYRIRCKDGTLKYVTDSGKKLTDIDGEEVFYGLYLDVTDERKMQEQANLASVFTALSIDYDNVSFFNFEEDTFRDFYLSDRYENISSSWRTARGLRKRIETFAANMMYETDRERYLEATKKETVYEMLKTKPAYYINYRVYKNDGSLARAQTKLVRDTSDPTGNTIISCFINLDSNGKRGSE